MALLKFGGNELRVHILEIFNNTLDKNKIPQEWEPEIVINTHIKGPKSKCKN
jgi:hypothetical protein